MGSDETSFELSTAGELRMTFDSSSSTTSAGAYPDRVFNDLQLPDYDSGHSVPAAPARGKAIEYPSEAPRATLATTDFFAGQWQSARTYLEAQGQNPDLLIESAAGVLKRLSELGEVESRDPVDEAEPLLAMKD